MTRNCPENHIYLDTFETYNKHLPFPDLLLATKVLPCHLEITKLVDMIFFIVPTPTVTVRRTPNDSTLYAGTQVSLTCTIELNGGAAVDTGVTVSTTWDGPSGVLTTGGRVTVSTPTIHGGYYESTLSITSLQSSDDGTYNCSAVVSPNTPSLYITESASLTVSSNFDVGEHMFSLFHT